MSKIAFSIGTRAELIKIFPVLKRLKNYTLIHTGQHNINQLLQQFGLREPDVVLSEPPKDSTKFYFNTLQAIKWSLRMTKEIGKAVKEQEAKVLVYHGDTMTTAASAIAAKRSKLIGVHLEAGLRSGSLLEPFPEELSRIISDNFSKIGFAVSNQTKKNLKNSFFFTGKAIKTGNTIVDSALEAYKLARKDIKPPKGDYAIVTAHRQENLRSYDRMLRLVRIVKSVPIDTYFFAHDNTIKALKKFRLFRPLAKHAKIAKISNYLAFIPWLAKSKLVLTDGGSIQEESLVFKKPCLVLRNRTERQEGLETGINFLTKLNIEESKKKISEYLSSDFEIPMFVNPYGRPGVSTKVVNELKRLI